MEGPIAYEQLAREDRFVRMRARRIGDLRVEQDLPPLPDLGSRESIRERLHGILVGNKLTEGDRGQRRRAVEFQQSIDERVGEAEEVPIAISTEIRRLAGFTDEEIQRLVRTTQRSPVY